TGFQKDVLAFDVPKLSQTLPEGLSKVRVGGWRPGQEHPDSGNFLHLLRLGGERHERETDSQNDRKPDEPHAAGESSEGQYVHQRPGRVARAKPRRSSMSLRVSGVSKAPSASRTADSRNTPGDGRRRSRPPTGRA